MATPRVTKKGRENARRRETLAHMHEAAMRVEGVLRKTMEVQPMIEALAKTPTRTWLRVGLEGLIRALDEKDGKTKGEPVT